MKNIDGEILMAEEEIKPLQNNSSISRNSKSQRTAVFSLSKNGKEDL